MRSPPDVDDIAQEAFLRAFATEHTRSIEQPKPVRIAKHVALSQLTRKARQITDYMEDFDPSVVVPTQDSAEEKISARQILGLHCEALAELSIQCRQVYLLRKAHGLSHRDISAQLGIAVSTVEKHLIKAVEQCDRYVRERSNPPRSEARSWGQRTGND
jgi:RNA polymerase sigma factor (sigma-70 family)